MKIAQIQIRNGGVFCSSFYYIFESSGRDEADERFETGRVDIEKRRGMWGWGWWASECNRKRDREPNGPYFLDGGTPMYSTLSWYSVLTETVNQSNV